MAELDIEKLLFADNAVDFAHGDFEVKFEIDRSSSFSDEDLAEAVESFEQSQQMAEIPDATMEADENIPDGPEETASNPAPSSSRERFPTVSAENIEEFVAGATSNNTNKMTRWGVQQFNRTTFFELRQSKMTHTMPI